MNDNNLVIEPDSQPGVTQVIARSPDYAQMAALVDDLSDSGFSVERLQIVGHGLHSIEQITGRMTKGRAALAGAGSGAWFGLFVGLLFSLFVAGPAWWGMLLWSALLGAVFGALFGFAGHAVTRGQRDFSSFQSLRAREYEVVTDPAHAAEAARLTNKV